jgi:hypothetical protein
MTACKLMLCLASALVLVTGCDDGQPSADGAPASEVPTQPPGSTPMPDAGVQGHTSDPAITPSHDASSAPYDAAAMRDTGLPPPSTQREKRPAPLMLRQQMLRHLATQRRATANVWPAISMPTSKL